MSLVREFRRLVCAVQFLTRLPTPRLEPFEPDMIVRSARYFPVAGELVGLVCAAVWLGAGRLWPGAPAAALAICAGVVVTGGLHEDGLADAADGFGGGQSREQRLTIMKDSRIGGFGALALGLTLLLKVSLLASLTPWAGALALVAAHGVARAAAVVVMAALPYAGDPGAAKLTPPPHGVRGPEALLAVGLGAWPLILLGPSKALLGLALAIGSSAGVALLARRAIGGVTGDVLGAVEQLAEAAVMLGAAAAIGP